MRLRPVLVDLGLVAVAVSCLALAALVVLPLFRAAPAPAGAGVQRVPGGVLALRAPGAPGLHLTDAGRRLGWVLGDAPLVLGPREADLAAQEAVVVQAADGPAEDAAAAVVRVRALQPRLRLVLVGPLGLVPGEQTAARDLLRETAVRAAADFVDPVGSRWLAGPGLVRDGQLTRAGASVVGQRLAEAVRRADQVRAQQTHD